MHIQAPLANVQYYIVAQEGRPFFNMAKLFPEKFGPDDASGSTNWNREWAIANTGSKWFPAIGFIGYREGETLIKYQTALWPNNKTLKRLHELTGRTIGNTYEEPEIGIAGTYRCRNGRCTHYRRIFVDGSDNNGEMKSGPEKGAIC